MANAVITVLESDGTTETDVTVLDVGRQAAAASKSFALATEDKSQLDAAVTSLQLIDDPIATLGTTTYTEATTKGVVIGAVRRDANTSLVDTTNEVAPLQVNATGELKVAQIQAIPAGSAIIGKVGIDQTTPGTTDRVTVGGVTLVDVTLSLDTGAYANGDLLADTQAVANAVRVNDGTGILHSVMIIDEDDNGAAFDLYFLSANNTLGSENSAPSITDAHSRDILCRVSVATADYADLGGVKVAQLHSLNRIIKGVSGGTSIYVAAVNGTGTPTYTASGVKLRIGIIQN